MSRDNMKAYLVYNNNINKVCCFSFHWFKIKIGDYITSTLKLATLAVRVSVTTN